MVSEDDLHGGGEGEEGAEYLYDDWGVDQVDLDFRTVSDLKSLLSERLAKLSPNLYKVSDQVDAKLMKQLKSLNPNLLQFSSTYPPSSSFHYQDYLSSSSTETPTLSSTNSIQSHSSLLSVKFNQSSTFTEDPQASLLGSVKTFPSLPTEETSPTDFANIFIQLGFLIFFLIIAIFVIIQCSHLAVYVFRATGKRRMQDRRLPFHSSSPQLSTLGQSAQARVESENIRNPIDFVVEVDSLNNISHHQMMMTPGSPVSILQNSPLSHYSPSSSLSLSVFPQSEDRTSPEDKISPLSPHYQDEGIESQEDIGGSALKQHIVENTVDEAQFQHLLSNTQNKEVTCGETDQTSPGSQTLGEHSVESPSFSLCSELNIAKSHPSLPQTRENPGFADIFGKVEKVANVEECLI